MTTPRFRLFQNLTAAQLAAAGYLLRCPHHTASVSTLIGYIHPRPNSEDHTHLVIQPGECSLADGGVLLLDHLTEFKPEAIQAIASIFHRQAVRYIRMSPDSTLTIEIPTRFDVFATTEACPCGLSGSACKCSTEAKKRFTDRFQAFRLLFEESAE